MAGDVYYQDNSWNFKPLEVDQVVQDFLQLQWDHFKHSDFYKKGKSSDPAEHLEKLESGFMSMPGVQDQFRRLEAADRRHRAEHKGASGVEKAIARTISDVERVLVYNDDYSLYCLPPGDPRLMVIGLFVGTDAGRLPQLHRPNISTTDAGEAYLVLARNSDDWIIELREITCAKPGIVRVWDSIRKNANTGQVAQGILALYEPWKAAVLAMDNVKQIIEQWNPDDEKLWYLR